jgi:hypothetical protein
MKNRVILFALTLLASASALHAATPVTFDLINKGHTSSGTATLTFETSKKGIKFHSALEYSVVKYGTPHAIDYKVDPDGLFLSASSYSVNDRAATLYSPAKGHTAVDIMLPGGDLQTVPNVKPDILVAFPEDPGVWQTLFQIAATHPHADGIYTLMVPGSKTTVATLKPFRLPAPTDSQGTLDGKDIALKHYTLTFAAGEANIYFDTDGNLMQADTPFSLKLVRKNFVLKP